jgi:transcriptional repressor NrdR
MEEIVDRIEKEVQETGDKEIDSSTIGETVMQELHDLDEIAYVRFASVYRSFKDINEFMDELKDMLEVEETRRLKEEKTKR